MSERDQQSADKASDALPFQCDAWSRRVHKCTAQCDGCFRREYEPRLLRAEKLLREFITTCEVHGLTSEKFFDLWSDAEAARVYFKEETPRSAGGLIAQGPCETTGTPRFQMTDCACSTYKGNLGPCLTWCEGGHVGHCVYCDHNLDCHVKLSKMLATRSASTAFCSECELNLRCPSCGKDAAQLVDVPDRNVT